MPDEVQAVCYAAPVARRVLQEVCPRVGLDEDAETVAEEDRNTLWQTLKDVLEWKRCDQFLPPPHERVIATDGGTWWVAHREAVPARWIITESHRGIRVTHWRPLPPLPGALAHATEQRDG